MPHSARRSRKSHQLLSAFWYCSRMLKGTLKMTRLFPGVHELIKSEVCMLVHHASSGIFRVIEWLTYCVALKLTRGIPNFVISSSTGADTMCPWLGGLPVICYGMGLIVRGYRITAYTPLFFATPQRPQAGLRPADALSITPTYRLNSLDVTHRK